MINFQKNLNHGQVLEYNGLRRITFIRNDYYLILHTTCTHFLVLECLKLYNEFRSTIISFEIRIDRIFNHNVGQRKGMPNYDVKNCRKIFENFTNF
jgi:hypothetical protein